MNSVLGQLRSADAKPQVVTQTANAVPGVVVTADAAKLREVAKRADVVSVRTVVPKTRTNASAEQLTNTLAAWQQTGKFGDNVRVGVIDDGIDYTHADFGGPGTQAAYKSVDSTKPTPLFPSAKVVGGTDLVGDDYDAATPGKTTPAPDPNPLACGEHGTHVAGTIGGFGVTADGKTFKGDYKKLDAKKVDAMQIGPGTAPKSLLYAIKVFGCEGSTNVTSQALDWALDPDGDGDFTDHLDIVNLSLGSDFGAPDDPDSLFVRKLAANNVLPVISAGNGGDINDIAGSPGNTPEALTVASTRDAGILRDAAEVKAPDGGHGPEDRAVQPELHRLRHAEPDRAGRGAVRGEQRGLRAVLRRGQGEGRGQVRLAGVGRQRLDPRLRFGGPREQRAGRRGEGRAPFVHFGALQRGHRGQRGDPDVPVHRVRDGAAARVADRGHAAGPALRRRPRVDPDLRQDDRRTPRARSPRAAPAARPSSRTSPPPVTRSPRRSAAAATAGPCCPARRWRPRTPRASRR